MRAVGMILAGGNSYRMKELSNKRAIAAMPIAGSFRSIDFALSSMSNSRIQKVAVLTQYNSRSLNEHLSSSKWWDFGRKQGGLYVFSPTVTVDNNFWYRGTADALYQNLDFLKNCHEPYVVIAAGDGVYKLDFNKVLEYHIAKKADITVVCKELPAEEDVTRFGVLKMNEECRIEQFEEKPMASDANTISCGIYVVRRRQLIELIEKSAVEGRFDFVRDVLIRYKNVKRIYGYKIDSYWDAIAQGLYVSFGEEIDDKYMVELKKQIIHQDVIDEMADKFTIVYTPFHGTGNLPVRRVLKELGFKNVFVGENCVIRNSIVLNDVYLGDNVHLENCIVESRDTIRANTYYNGEDGIKIVIESDERYVL